MGRRTSATASSTCGAGRDLGNGKQRVYQRIYRSDGTFWDRSAGEFIYHPSHNHIHVESWCIYRVREILPGDGVGAVVAEGEKTSFCLMDLGVHDPSLPNFDPDGQFFECATTVQGISVGWYDVYGKHLDGQWIDITDVAPGEYWLEAEVDPEGHVLETDETNNVKRVRLTIPDFSGGDDRSGPVRAEQYICAGALAGTRGADEPEPWAVRAGDAGRGPDNDVGRRGHLQVLLAGDGHHRRLHPHRLREQRGETSGCACSTGREG
jgi:hypothetical protein